MCDRFSSNRIFQTKSLSVTEIVVEWRTHMTQLLLICVNRQRERMLVFSMYNKMIVLYTSEIVLDIYFQNRQKNKNRKIKWSYIGNTLKFGISVLDWNPADCSNSDFDVFFVLPLYNLIDHYCNRQIWDQWLHIDNCTFLFGSPMVD